MLLLLQCYGVVAASDDVITVGFGDPVYVDTRETITVAVRPVIRADTRETIEAE